MTGPLDGMLGISGQINSAVQNSPLGQIGAGLKDSPLGQLGNTFHSFMDSTFGQIPGLKDLFSGSPMPTTPDTPFHDAMSQLPQGSNIFDMLHTNGMAGLSQLPPQLSQFLQDRVSPVDHNPWEPKQGSLSPLGLTGSSYQNNG